MEEVRSWLERNGMAAYYEHFKQAGYDDLKVICDLDARDLDAMGIDKPGTRKKFLICAKELAQEQGKTTSGNKRSMPYRCTKCCQFKIRSLDGKAHRCDPALLNHSFADCPTRNIRRHPEERKRRKEVAESIRAPARHAPMLHMPQLRHLAAEHHTLLPLHHTEGAGEAQHQHQHQHQIQHQVHDPHQHDHQQQHQHQLQASHQDLMPMLPMKRAAEVLDCSQLPSWDTFREEEMARIKQECGDMLDPDKVPEYNLAIVRRYKELQDLHRKWKLQRHKAPSATEERREMLPQDMQLHSPLPMPSHEEHHRHPMELDVDEASMRTLIPELSH